jgi:hypothetical protein
MGILISKGWTVRDTDHAVFGIYSSPWCTILPYRGWGLKLHLPDSCAAQDQCTVGSSLSRSRSELRGKWGFCFAPEL